MRSGGSATARASPGWTSCPRSAAVPPMSTLSQDHYRALIEGASDAILILDPAHRILEANRAAEVLLGRPRTELVGGGYDDFVVPDERESSARMGPRLVSESTVRVET